MQFLVPFSLSNFPFDDQYFDLNFYCWSLYVPQVYISGTDPFLVYDDYSYIENAVWKIKSVDPAALVMQDYNGT